LEGNPTLDGVALKGWTIYSITGPGDLMPQNGAAVAAPTGPVLYTGSFTLGETGETYLDLSNFHFGAVWVNGHNLGRYWDRGGLRSLFLSEHFLKGGENEVVVMELHGIPKAAVIGSSTKIIEEAAVPFALRLDQRVPAPATQAGRGRGQ